MPSAPRKLKTRRVYPLPVRTLGFGLLLVAWWLLSIELPARNLSTIRNTYGISQTYPVITDFVHDLTTGLQNFRWLGAIFIIALTICHYVLWKRFEKCDAWPKFLFRFGVVVFYVLLYGFFFVMFLGAELPLWLWPRATGGAG